MDLPISIQDLDDPNKPKQRPEWIHHPGVYYNKHLEKVMAIDKTLENLVLSMGVVKRKGEKRTLEWYVLDPDNEAYITPFQRELRREDFRAISGDVLRDYDKDKFYDGLYVLHCACNNCEPIPINYILVYSEHDQELCAVALPVPKGTNAVKYFEHKIKSMRVDKAVRLSWTRKIRDPVEPLQGKQDAPRNVWLEFSAFTELGEAFAEDWEQHKIDSIYVKQYYPCSHCEELAIVECQNDLTDNQ